LAKHLKVCGQVFLCDICGLSFGNGDLMRAHLNEHTIEKANSEKSKKRKSNGSDKPPLPKRKKKNTVKCRKCQREFPNWSLLYKHKKVCDLEGGGVPGLQADPYDDINEDPLWLNSEGEFDAGLAEVYYRYQNIILAPHSERQGLISTFNFPLTNNFTLENLSEYVDRIRSRQSFAFKINMSFGFLLKNKRSGEIRYFYPQRNTDILPKPVLISNSKDVLKLSRRLEVMDLLTLLMTNRDSTEWDFICVTNVLFTTYKTQFPIGGVSAVPLPDYVKNSRAIIALQINRRTTRAYDDRYCAFRALAFHNSPYRQSDIKKALKGLEGRTKYYLGKWLKHTSTSPEEFEGVSMDQIGDFEKLFSVDISVYMLEENLIATAVYISQEAFKNHMFLNIF
jgi:hypothetical protein